MSIIITAPHSACLKPALYRDCDLRAAQSAGLLHDALSVVCDDVTLLLSDTHRDKMDLNRAESRDTDWWRRLQKVIEEKAANGPVFVCDMHSFPSADTTSELRHLKAYFLLLEHDIYSFRTGATKYAVSWPDVSSGLRVAQDVLGAESARVVRGSDVNAILMETFRHHNVDGILLEVNEDVSILPDNELEDFMSKFADLLATAYCREIQ